MTGPRLTTALLLLTALPACSEPSEQTQNEDETAVTYYDDVEPIVTEHCAGCHHPDEGAPIDLHTYEDVQATAQLSLEMMDNDEMPPWPPDPECREYKDQRVMPDEDVQVFRDWIEAGEPAGERPEDFEPFEPDEVAEPDIRASISDPPYEPREDLDDEYRCFLLDKEFQEDTFVTGTYVDTGGAEVVHHANIYMANPFYVDDVKDLEASEDEPGYDCFGDPGFTSIDVLGTWVPGARPISLPEDSAAVVEEGSRMVLQTHFNTLFAEPEPVDPEVHLYTRDEEPEREVWAMPFAQMDFEIPPGESEYEIVETFENHGDDPWEILGAFAHMHEFGTSTSLQVVHDDNSKTCMVDIPQWDFDWQLDYRFLDDEWVEVQPGEGVRFSCTYDNTPDNQPIVDGEQQDPEPVTWGARTTDEMCMAFMLVIEDYEPPADAEMCEPFMECRNNHEDCQDDPFGVDCIFNCATVEHDCGYCLIEEAETCARDHCEDGEVEAAAPCLISCAQGVQQGGDLAGCLDEECPEERDDLQDCLQPALESGQCNTYLQECNVEL